MNNVKVCQGIPGVHYKITGSNTAQNLSTTVVSENGHIPSGALLRAETYGIRFTFGGTTVTQAGHGFLLLAGESLYLSNSAQVKTFQFINAVNGQNAILQVCAEFEGRS